MIDIQNTGSDKIRVIVQGNQSMSWRANLWLAASLGFICIGTGIVLAFMGMWLILPFAGLEVLFVLFCLYLTLRRLARKEIITVDKHAIQLEWGSASAEQSAKLPRQWSQLRYDCSDNLFETGDLTLAAHGRRYRLGEALGRDEKKLLHSELAAVLRQF